MNSGETETTLSSTVLVDGLSYNVRRAHIDEIFGHFGRVRDVELGYRMGHSTGRALVHYCAPESAQSAVAHMNGGNIDGCDIAVRLADPNATVDAL